jgi:hypothetical protein
VIFAIELMVLVQMHKITHGKITAEQRIFFMMRNLYEAGFFYTEIYFPIEWKVFEKTSS